MGTLIDLLTQTANPVPFKVLEEFVSGVIGEFNGYKVEQSRIFPKGQGVLVVSTPGLFGRKNHVLYLKYDPMDANPQWEDKTDYNNPLVIKVVEAMQKYTPSQ